MTKDKQPQEAETPDTQEAEDQASAEGEKEVDYKAEIAKYKAIAERKTKQLEKVTSSLKDEEEPKKPTGEALDVDTVLDLQAKGFQAKDIKAIKDEAANLGVSVAKLAENETWVNGFKAKLDAETEENNVTDATPSPTGKIVVGKNKTFDQVVTDPEASEEEKQAAFESYKQQKFSRGNN